MPVRSGSGHKGTFGTALKAAGSEHYWGAPLLAAQAAYCVGAGLVALAVPEVIRATVAGQMPEATYPAVAATRVLGADSARFLLEQSGSVRAMLIGPGRGPAVDFVQTLLERQAEAGGLYKTEQVLPPMVVDADGLNALAKLPDWWKRVPSRTILTPHPGEMARLMGATLSEVKTADRVDLACERANDWGYIVLLKGAYIVVADPDGHCMILPFANPLLSVGGSGDVLAGIIVGLLAQGLKPYDAAVLGGCLHGSAGELAAEKLGDAGLLAGELASWIPMARQRILDT